METIERGNRSKAILNDPLVEEALEAIEKGIIETWQSSTVTETREELWYTLMGLRRFKGIFETAISSGEFELSQKSEE